MDGPRFDALARSLATSGSRRHAIVSVILGGGSLLVGIADVLARGNKKHNDQKSRKRRVVERSADDVAADKRKRTKKHKTKGKHPNQDQAPPCTLESCPIPPGCSQQVLNACTSALFEALLADVEPCRPSCEDDANGAACQECLQPIVTARLPEAEACAGESCSSSPRLAAAAASPASAAARHRARQRARNVTTEAWWVRHCDKPTCCLADLRECNEDVAEDLFICLFGAVGTAAVSGPVALPVLAGCMAKLVYDDEKCQARHGCPEGFICFEGDKCCIGGEKPCGNECCSAFVACDQTTATPTCCPAQRVCGEKCCGPGQLCDRSKSSPECCPEERTCGTVCCTSEETCHSGLSCCKTDKKCGLACCEDDQICHPGVLTDPPICCDVGSVPCGKGGFRFCCEPGESCARSTDPEGGSQCCAQGSTPCDGECCPQGQYCCKDKTCCPNDEPACYLGGAGFAPFCCVEGRIPCGFDCCSADAGECCPPSDLYPHYYCCTQGSRCKVSRGPTCE